MQSADQMVRSSNLDRSAYRTKCRQKLSEHIRKIWLPIGGCTLLTSSQVIKLGISIEPAEVRLITSASDPYTWQALPEKQHLFRKNLSKHSIGAYRELCRGVGVSFEASLVNESSKAAEERLSKERPGAIVCVSCIAWPPTNNMQNTSNVDNTFTTVIEQLEAEKRKLTAELQESYVQAAKAMDSKELAEEKVTRLTSLIQAADMEKQLLQQQVLSLTGMVEYLRNTTVNSVDEFISRLKLDLSLFRG